jgi:TIR domain
MPSSQATPDAPIIFYSYAREDQRHVEALRGQLAVLRQQGMLQEWYDRKISPGGRWAAEIDENLEKAHVILMLLSPDFFSSDYCWGVETKRALERHQTGEAVVIPVIVRPVNWGSSPFAGIQALPSNAKAVTTWGNRDEAWLDVAQGLQTVLRPLSGQP